MSFPSTPTQLLNAATEARAREIFRQYDEFSKPMQLQCQLLLQLGMSGELSDFTFRELGMVLLHFWKDCNQKRFHDEHHEGGDLETLVRVAQIDQFLSGSINNLNELHQLTDDTFHVAEPDGS